jgi:hypothetical protein
MQKSISDIVSDIRRTKLPAIIIDTCVSLDIVRCIWRENSRIVGIAKQLIDAQLNGELLLYAHSVLQKEALRNRAEVEGEAQKKAMEIDQAISQYRQAAEYLGIDYSHSAGPVHQRAVPALLALHDELLATCVHIVPEDKNRLAAFLRGSNNRRPACKGGGANDCLMFEEFRNIAYSIPEADPLILFTTNSNDFVDKANGANVVHQEITDDLVGTKAQLCFKWDWVASLVLNEARMKSISEMRR